MKNRTTAALSTLCGFLAGIGVMAIPLARATQDDAATDLGKRRFYVTLDEVKQQFTFFKEFSGRYQETVKMSDGTTRSITLTPTVHNGMQGIEINDNGGITYTALNGRVTNGNLLIEVRDIETWNRLLREQGWGSKSP